MSDSAGSDKTRMRAGSGTGALRMADIDDRIALVERSIRRWRRRGVGVVLVATAAAASARVVGFVSFGLLLVLLPMLLIAVWLLHAMTMNDLDRLRRERQALLDQPPES